MAIIAEKATLPDATVARIQAELRARGIDGWLLYNFRGLNPVAGEVLGLPALTRRTFVWVPAEGRPAAVTHRIEQQPWSQWPHGNHPYSAWRELEALLPQVLGGARVVAMEYAPGNAVPTVDRVPAGVLEMVRATGAEVVSSGDLVSTFYSRWTEAGVASHLRAAAVVRDAAHRAFLRIAERVREGNAPTEWEARSWIVGWLEEGGLTVGADATVAVNANAANPHYGATETDHATIGHGDLVLIDLWGKEAGEGAIYADQTWMGYVGAAVPERLAEIFRAVTDARDAAVALVRERHAAGEPACGWEADDAARAVIEERGWGAYFIHRTGHSIDHELHGSGPNLDNLETRDTRTLIPGVGFSVEPGIYLPGDVGFRSEIDVYLAPDGPRVTPDGPQTAVYALLAPDPFGA